MKAIMVMFDSLNRHLLAPYGCHRTHTPNFQRLAERAVTFDRNYVCSMPCMPARRDLHTGRPGFLHRGWGPLEPYDQSMPELLKQHGVTSHLLTDHYHYFEPGGANYHARYSSWQFFRGQEGDPWFPVTDTTSPLQPTTTRRDDHTLRQDQANRGWMNNETRHCQTRTFDAGLDFLDANHQHDHWFLQLETFDPHEPFFASDTYRRLFSPDDEGPVTDWPDYGELASPERAALLDPWRKAYYALLAQCDANLGRVLDRMDAHDLWLDTLLIVCTDHGFLLGEHNHTAKNEMPLWEELSHTPLFIWDPRCGRRGKRCAHLTSTIDWAPTILDFFGLEAPATMTGRPLGPAIATDTPVRDSAIFGYHGHYVNVTDGRYVYMRAAASPDNAPLYTYTLEPAHMRAPYPVEQLQTAAPGRAFAHTRGLAPTRYDAGPGAAGVLNRFGTLLYDVVEDPGQTRPLQDPEVEERMIGLLHRHLGAIDAPPEQYLRLGLRLGSPQEL